MVGSAAAPQSTTNAASVAAAPQSTTNAASVAASPQSTTNALDQQQHSTPPPDLDQHVEYLFNNSSLLSHNPFICLGEGFEGEGQLTDDQITRRWANKLSDPQYVFSSLCTSRILPDGYGQIAGGCAGGVAFLFGGVIRDPFWTWSRCRKAKDSCGACLMSSLCCCIGWMCQTTCLSGCLPVQSERESARARASERGTCLLQKDGGENNSVTRQPKRRPKLRRDRRKLEDDEYIAMVTGEKVIQTGRRAALARGESVSVVLEEDEYVDEYEVVVTGWKRRNEACRCFAPRPRRGKTFLQDAGENNETTSFLQKDGGENNETGENTFPLVTVEFLSDFDDAHHGTMEIFSMEFPEWQASEEGALKKYQGEARIRGPPESILGIMAGDAGEIVVEACKEAGIPEGLMDSASPATRERVKKLIAEKLTVCGRKHTWKRAIILSTIVSWARGLLQKPVWDECPIFAYDAPYVQGDSRRFVRIPAWIYEEEAAAVARRYEKEGSWV